ncbi:hypothetical protein [uncultured Deefgea sp.]|uniref:hypothetical protein n=1 Tax=uncultured Deefgea sp. TaxID=1304914 RepID=UPI0026176188|nr:hypothetical protein [uncultured Deefgea sp.]
MKQIKLVESKLASPCVGCYYHPEDDYVCPRKDVGSKLLVCVDTESNGNNLIFVESENENPI